MVGLCRFKLCLRQDLIIRRDVEEILVHSGARDAVLHDGAALGSIGNDILEGISCASPLSAEIASLALTVGTSPLTAILDASSTR